MVSSSHNRTLETCPDDRLQAYSSPARLSWSVKRSRCFWSLYGCDSGRFGSESVAALRRNAHDSACGPSHRLRGQARSRQLVPFCSIIDTWRVLTTAA